MVRVLHNDFIGCPAPDTAQGKAVHLVRDAGIDLQPGQRGLDAQDILAHIHKGPGRRAGQPAVFCFAKGGGVAASHHLAVDIRLGAVDLTDVLNVCRAGLFVDLKRAVTMADYSLGTADPWVVVTEDACVLLVSRGIAGNFAQFEMDLSAMKEIGNIIAGSYLSALAGMTNLVISPSVPYIAVDMAASILSVPAIQFGQYGDNALFIETEFGDDVLMDGYFILMPEPESYTKILSALGIQI